MQVEADRLHEGLRRSFAEVFGRIEEARLEDRAGYRLLICPRLPVPPLNGIWLEGPDGSADIRGLEGAIDEVESAGGPCWVLVRHGRTPAMEREVRRLGWTHQESLPGMVLHPPELVVVPGPELEVAAVRDEAGLAVATSVAAAGFEAPPEMLAALFTPEVAAAPGLSIYVARAEGRPVSTATAWLGDGGVGIFNVATPPEHRGRGYGRAVTARAVEDGFASGAELAWLQSSAMGEPVYRKMGFRQVETYVVLGRPTSG